MTVLRVLVAVLLAAALLAGMVLAAPGSFIVAGPGVLVAFIVSGGALALDVLDGQWAGVAADVLVFAAALATTIRLPGAVAILALALAAQALPRVIAWRRPARPRPAAPSGG
jgi:hypothetical protein